MRAFFILLLPLAFAIPLFQTDSDSGSPSGTKNNIKDSLEKLLEGATDPEIRLGPGEIAQYWKYPVLYYDTKTEDGYELDLLRIPGGRHEENATLKNVKRPVVFLQHGLDGSWDEMARYDLPALINKALEVSKADKLYYVGFSLGTTTAFAKFSQDKEFAKKIKKFYALAPMTTLGHIKGPLRLLAQFTGALETVFSLIGNGEFAPNPWLMEHVARQYCANAVSNLLCKSALFLIGGPESNQLNATRIPVYLSSSPGGTSTRTIIHMGQMVKSGKFQAYDYGNKNENQQHYHQDHPLEYDVSAIETPIAIYSGGQDWMSDPADVAALMSRLRNVVDNVYLPDFNNFDFIWGLRAAPLIYWPIRNDIRTDFATSQ